MDNKKTVAIVPGSFDPITYGHLFLINEAVQRYDKVFVAVMINANKQYTFSLEERTDIAKSAVKNIPNVEVISSDGWLYELANTLKADAIVKGYRNEFDLKYEEEMAEFNRKYAKNTETILIQSPKELTEISSTLVRNEINNKNNINDFLPKDAIEKIERILKNRNK